MSAAPCRVLAFAVLAAALPSFALASPYTDAAETAVFTLCPAFHERRISGDRPAALTRFGYRRRPEIEEDMGDAEDGMPFIFTRGRGADEIILHYWGIPDLCTVDFSAERGAEAVARVQARLAREPRRFRPVPTARWTEGNGQRRSWLTTGRRPMCLAIYTGSFAMTGYGTSFAPHPVLQPGTSRSACDPPPEGN